MTSVQRFLSGHDNLARTAVLAASSVRASTAMERVATRRAGGGRVRLDGSYTGHEAAAVQVEIVAAGGVPRASVPQFVGVGNGRLDVLGVEADAPLQQFTLTLADLGVDTTHAALDVREVRLRARVPGSAGNAIRVTVQPQLTRAATSWALLSDWSTGAAVQTGPQWDFGGLPLSPKDELDEASPRIAFGFDPQVYRPWRKFKDGAWQFGLSPALQRPVASGTAVFTVTGGYVVTVTDGVATETYGDTAASQPEIVTFHDLLTALQASALVEVAGVVAADRAAGGQAAVDVPLRTQAWLLALSGKVSLQDVAAPPDAPTQTVTVRCINADVVGAERWSVAGDVSGALPAATTGTPYDSAAVRFLVPAVPPSAQGSGEWSFKYQPASRQPSQGVPSVCVRPFRFGRNARPQSVTFTYQRRPPADCKCSDMPTPKVSLKCLGLLEGDGMSLDPAHQTRLQDLYAWRSGFAASNTQVGPVPDYARHDMDFADAVTGALAEALGEVYEVAPALAEWDLAFAAMQTDLASLAGLSALRQWPRTQEQNVPSRIWVNPVTKKAFLCVTAYSYASMFARGQRGWKDATDAAWDDSGVDFPVSYPANPAFGDEWGDAMYRCVGDLSDLPESIFASSGDYPVDAMPMVREQLLRRYTSRMDYVRALAGILQKSDSSSADAGGCWIDHGDAFWWVDSSGYYLPAFSNQAYVSARRNTETGKPYSTMEFGFGLVVACPERLIEGDQLTITIARVDGERPYQVGDQAVIQTIAAGPAWLVGGVDGTDEQTWRVAGSASGALPDYIVPTQGAVPAYAQAGVSLHMALGGIPFMLGDSFTLAVEAGQYRWRRDGGAWAAPADIPPSGPAVLDDGLLLHFDAGAAPSFVPGDACDFAVHQPHAASHVRDAQATAWAWAGAGASMVLGLGAVQALGAIALARYSLPPGATVTAELSSDGVTWGAPHALDVSRPVALRFLAATASHVRIAVAGAPGGSIGWIWVGEPFATQHHASGCQRRRHWAATRADGVNAASMYAGAGDGWSVEWGHADNNFAPLLEADIQTLMRLLDWAQVHDEPLIFAPHHLHPRDAALVRLGEDALEVRDEFEWQTNDAARRLLAAALTLEPVYA